MDKTYMQILYTELLLLYYGIQCGFIQALYMQLAPGRAIFRLIRSIGQLVSVPLIKMRTYIHVLEQ